MQVLADLGAMVEQVDPGFEDPATIFRTLWWSGARALLDKLAGGEEGLARSGLADVVEQSMSITPDDYFEACSARGVLGSQMRLFMENYDLLVTPTLPIPAFEAGQAVARR